MPAAATPTVGITGRLPGHPRPGPAHGPRLHLERWCRRWRCWPPCPHWAAPNGWSSCSPIPRPARADARLAAAHIVRESKEVIADLLAASGASAHFVSHPMQRYKRDVDVLAGHVVFDYDISRELAGALAPGLKVSAIAMI